MGCAAGTPSPQSAANTQGGAMHAPESPENHRGAALQLFAQLNMQAVLDGAIETMLKTQLAQSPQLAPIAGTMRDFFAMHMSWASLEDEFLRIYTDAFTQRELEDMVAFYKTPTGKKAIQFLPELMQKGAAIGQARVQQNLPELKQRIEERMQELPR
jgi:hypothetical protein